MSFLGRAFSMGRSFLGAARAGSHYLGRAMPSVMGGIEAAGRLASNPLTQQVGAKLGIDPSHFRTLSRGATNVGNALAMVPDAMRDVQNAGHQVRGALLPAKRTLADIYAAARGASA